MSCRSFRAMNSSLISRAYVIGPQRWDTGGQQIFMENKIISCMGKCEWGWGVVLDNFTSQFWVVLSEPQFLAELGAGMGAFRPLAEARWETLSSWRGRRRASSHIGTERSFASVFVSVEGEVLSGSYFVKRLCSTPATLRCLACSPVSLSENIRQGPQNLRGATLSSSLFVPAMGFKQI